MKSANSIERERERERERYEFVVYIVLFTFVNNFNCISIYWTLVLSSFLPSSLHPPPPSPPIPFPTVSNLHVNYSNNDCFVG